jgi:hypothetical protein
MCSGQGVPHPELGDRSDSARKTEVKEEWGRPLLKSRDPHPDLAFFFLNLLVSYFETYPCWRISSYGGFAS